MCDRLNASLLFTSVISLGILIAGCSTVTMRCTDESPLALEHDETVVMIVSNHSSVSPQKISSTFREIENCVAETVREIYPSIRVVKADDFRRVAFPGLDFEEMPRGQDYILSLLKDQKFIETIAPLKLKYLFLMTGNTTGLTNQSGGIVCGGGYGGAGCLGLAVWDKTAFLQASIIDAKYASQVGDLNVTVTGKPWFAMVGIVPVGLPAFPENRVCEELGKAIAKSMNVDSGVFLQNQEDIQGR